MQRGFSLVELSIVLVILGLLTGGILAGKSLIRAAELRSVSTNFQRYQAAVNSFRDRYMALPGDITNATSFWGIASGTTGNDATCYNTDSTTISDTRLTCNGNGNGRWLVTDGVSDTSDPEGFRAWQHLANAGLVEGSYTGTKISGTTRKATPGKNVPAGKISRSGFTFMSYDVTAADTWGWTGQYHGLVFGAESSDQETGEMLLNPEDAWNIDSKLDDGNPAYGLVRDFRDNTGCHNGTDPATAKYTVSTSTVECSLFLAFTNPGS